MPAITQKQTTENLVKEAERFSAVMARLGHLYTVLANTKGSTQVAKAARAIGSKIRQIIDEA
jgi:hypothetical protein